MILKKIFKNPNLLPILVLIITILPRAINLFGYPYFENDEGVYTSQAWWLMNFGKLAPYTYWYDHAPFGWLIIGLWQRLTLGPFTFGFSLFSTRIFMVIVTGFTSYLIYKLCFHLTKSKKASFLACLVLAFSPLAIIYQRRVLLDNLETFWLILSLWFFFKAKSRLNYIWLSAVFFGFSFLSKESVILLFPVMLYAVWVLVNKQIRNFSMLVWFITASFLIGLFSLLALLKGEFFPSSWFGDRSHVSLLETVIFQMGRGSEVSSWHPDSMLRLQLTRWFSKGFFIMFLGFWSVLVNLVFNWKKKQPRIIVFLTLAYFIFLARGGLVLEFYILPLLALFILNIAYVLLNIRQFFGNKFKPLFSLPVYLLVVLLLSFAILTQETKIYTSKPTEKQLEALDFVKKNLDENDFIVIDDHCFMDLRLTRFKGDKNFSNAEWFWKVEDDSEIRQDKLYNDWRNIDYILLSGEMRRKLVSGELPFLKQAFDNSYLVKDFPSEHQDEQGKIEDLSRRGDGWASLFKVKNKISDDGGFKIIL